MTAEQLNIKMNLDIGDLLSDVKRVKTQISGMAASVKSSLPKISSESKGASNALSGVTRASKDVKKSLENIGDEARDSLQDVAKYSKTAATALKSMKDSGNGTKLGFDTDEMSDGVDDVTNSFEDMQGAMSAIVGMDFFSALASNWDKIKASTKTAVASVVTGFKQIGKAVTDAIGDFQLMGKIDKLSLKFIAKDAKAIAKSFAAAGKAALKAVGPILALAAAISAVALAANAIGVSELGKDIYTNAQRCGMSAQVYQEWAYVLQRAGIEADELKEVVKTLTEAQVDVIEGSEDMIIAFNKLGLSAQEVAGMSQQQLWGETVKRLQNIGDVTQRTAIAYKLFGEDASKLTTVLNLSNAETQKLINTYNQLGGTMSQELLVNSQVLQGSLANLKVAWQGLKNTLAQAVIPVVITLVDWLTQAMAAVSAFLQVFFGLDLTPATDSLAGGFITGSNAVDGYKDALEQAGGAAEALKRSVMGFDELNVVPNPASSGGGGASGGGNIEIPSMGGANSIFQEASKQAEEFKKKMEGFFQEYKEEIAIIGGALASLGISKLLSHLGQALGLGDKFMGFVNGIAKLATSAIVITLQYTLTNEFFDSFIDGEGIKQYLLGLLVSAIGTGVLYSMWGPTGAVIGLLVTAVAGIKAVIDNEGITNAESGAVAFTSLGAAIAALGIAWKKLGISGWIVGIKEWLAAAKLMAPEVGTLAAYFPKLATAISKVVGVFSKLGGAIKGIPALIGKIGAAIKGGIAAVGSFAGGIGSALGLTGGAAIAAGAAIIVAAIAAIAGTIMFVVNHWNELVQAVKDFWKENIVPKFESIGESLKKLWEAIKGVGQAFAQLGQVIWNAIPQGFKDFLASIGAAIRDVVVAIGEWFASIDWLGAIKTAFEFLGMIVVDIVGGVIMGAINALIGAIDGVVQFISGAVQIVAGLVEAIVKLFSGDLQGAWDAVKKIGQGILDCFVGLYKATIGVVVDFVKGIIDWFVEMWDVLVGHSVVPDTVEAIIEWFGKMVRTVVEAIAGFVRKIIEFFVNLFDTVVTGVTTFVGNVINWFGNMFAGVGEIVGGLFSTVVTFFSNMFSGVVETVTNMVETVIGWFTSLGEGIKKLVMGFINIVIEQFKKMKDNAVAMLKGVVEFFKQAWSGVKNIWDVAGNWFSGIWGKIKNVFSPVANWFKNIFQSAWNGITSIFDKTKNYFSGIWDTIKGIFSNVGTSIAQGVTGAVKGAVNAVLSGVVNKINTFIGWINAAIGVINNIPGVNIGKIGTLSVPQLEHGGIVTSETLARIGERGKREAVLPLEQHTGWMDTLADKIASRNNNNTSNALPTKIVLQVGETELGWATINSINGITKQQGGLQLHLV
jgi:phage-related protein